MLKKDWKKTLLDEKSSIKAAVQCLEKSAANRLMQINNIHQIPIIDKNKKKFFMIFRIKFDY